MGKMKEEENREVSSSGKNIDPDTLTGSENSNGEVVLGEVRQEAHYSGPIPPPANMAHYEEILPGSADRILKMSEKSLEHVQHMEWESLKAEVELHKRGQNYGMAALVVLFLGALFCVYAGEGWVATAFLSVAAFGAVAHFINGKQKKRQ